MFLKTVLADGQAEKNIIAEMKARAAQTRSGIERAVREIMEDVRQNGEEAVTKYSLQFDGERPCS